MTTEDLDAQIEAELSVRGAWANNRLNRIACGRRNRAVKARAGMRETDGC